MATHFPLLSYHVWHVQLNFSRSPGCPGADSEILIRVGANRGAEDTEGVVCVECPLPTGGPGPGHGAVPPPQRNLGYCISHGDFWCILGAIFYSLDAHFTHKKHSFALEIGGQIHKLEVLSSRSTETANDTRNSLMENMLCLFSTIRCNEICV